MEHELRQHLFVLADAFAASTGRTRATIGKNALNDNTFFARIERGDGFNVRTFDRTLQWFSDNWPDDLDWPKGIARPAPTQSENAA